MTKYLRKIASFYKKEIDFYAGSLSFLTIFSLIPISMLIVYIFSLMGIFDTISIYVLSFLNFFFPKNDILKEYLAMFLKTGDTIGIWTLSYIIIVSIIFIREYKSIISEITQYTFSYKESIIFYTKNIFLLPLAILLYFFIMQEITVSLYNPFSVVLFFIIYYFGLSGQKRDILLIFKISFVVAFLFEVSKSLYIIYTFYNKAYYNIYGSLSVILFLLLWIYISWLIYLYGLQYYYNKLKSI